MKRWESRNLGQTKRVPRHENYLGPQEKGQSLPGPNPPCGENRQMILARRIVNLSLCLYLPGITRDQTLTRTRRR